MPGSGKDHPPLSKQKFTLVDDKPKMTHIETACLVLLGIIIMGAIVLVFI
jgi:hypothetical protein